MIFSQLSKREKTILFFTAAVISISLFYGFAFEPLFKKWLSLDNIIASKEMALKKSTALLGKYNQIKKEYEKYAFLSKGTKTDEALLSGLLMEAESLARKSSVYPGVLKPYGTRDYKAYQKFLAELELEATMKELVDFLYQLEASDKLLKIESLRIEAIPRQKGYVKSRLIISSIAFKD